MVGEPTIPTLLANDIELFNIDVGIWYKVVVTSFHVQELSAPIAPRFNVILHSALPTCLLKKYQLRIPVAHVRPQVAHSWYFDDGHPETG